MKCLYKMKKTATFCSIFLFSFFVNDYATAKTKVLFYQAGNLWEPIEWKIENVSFDGNPFDVVAKVIFTNEKNTEKRITEMFFVDNHTWKFRFTATKTGKWTFTTQSANTDLAGYSGQIEIKLGSTKYGFVTPQDNEWARQIGDHGELEAFVPQFVMYESPQNYYRQPEKVDRDIATFIDEHGFSGFHTPIYCRWFDINESRSKNISASSPNPDLRTFEALEMLISKVHAAGGIVHIWMWGDESRTQTPKKWGLNGTADKRLQRYIAARLGPLPGWTMGYGFDLWEWVTDNELTEWHDFLHQHFGWSHMLGARSEKNKLTQLSEAMDYASYELHRPDYAMYVRMINERPNKPAFSEDRFRIRDSKKYREKDYSMETTRRGLWHSTLAGGVANIWGNLIPNEPGAERGGSYRYPNPEWIKTYARFFDRRFLIDFHCENSVTDGMCLADSSLSHFVIYKEDSSSIRLNLEKVSSLKKAIAVDTKKTYREIDIKLSPYIQEWQAPYLSDWAIAIGEF